MRVLAGLPGRRQRLLVAAQAVAEDGGRPVRPRHRRLPAPRLRPPRWWPRSAGRPRLPCPGTTRASWRRRARCGTRSPRRPHRPPRSAKRRPRSHRSTRRPWPSSFSRIGSWSSAPASRASWTCRRGHAPAIVVPQSVGPLPVAIQPHRSTSSAGMSALAKALAACRSAGAAAAGPSVTSSARPSSSRSAGRGGCARRGQGPGGAGDLQQVAGAGQMPGEHRRAPRVQIGLARQVEVERLQPPGRLQQQRRSVAAQARGERDLPAQQVHPGALQLIQRPGLRRGQQVRGPCRTRRPAGWPAPRPACARRGAPDRPSAPPRAPGTPRPRPARRGPAPGPAERSSSAATSSSGPAAAWARCQARRSGSACGSVASASAACTCCLSGNDADR